MPSDVAADRDAAMMAGAEDLAGWEELAKLMAQQRDMLLRRDHNGLTELNRMVAGNLADQATRYRQSTKLIDGVGNAGYSTQFPAETPSKVAARLDELQRNVRNQARINCELAADALAYAEFLLEMLYPQTRSPVYDEGGKVNGCHVNAAVNWEA